MFRPFKRVIFRSSQINNNTLTFDAIKAYRLNGSIAVFIVRLRIRWVVQLLCSGRFTSGKETRSLLRRRLRVPQSRSGRFGEEKKFLPLAKFKHLIFDAVV